MSAIARQGGWFPLKEGSHRSTYDNPCEEMETAYLLDPIDIEDVKLLAFDEEGKAIACPGASDWEKQRVAETVRRLKLNEHAALTDERRKVWMKVSRLIGEYRREIGRCSAGGNEVARAKAKEVAKQIHEMTQATAELSAVAKWCVLFCNDPRLARLIGV